MSNSAAAGNTMTERAPRNGCLGQKFLGRCSAYFLLADVSRHQWTTNKRVDRQRMYALFIMSRAPGDTALLQAFPESAVKRAGTAIKGTILRVFVTPVD